MTRDEQLSRLGARTGLVVIGGGATGAGVAWEAATRGLGVVLFEARDFGAGTSSRSTKLIHGGVRYLAQGRFGLVREALRERALLRRNAPAFVNDLRFAVPVSGWPERWRYRCGLALYDLLDGGREFPPSAWLSRRALAAAVPNLAHASFAGAVSFHDGQFDDAALLLAVIAAAAVAGASCLNYAAVRGLLRRRDGRVCGVQWQDLERGSEHELEAACVVNAAGPGARAVGAMDGSATAAMPTLRLSRGSHLVVGPEFLGGDTALLMPRVDDGRVMFAIPWQGCTLLGTTDVPAAEAEDEPRPDADEIALMLATAARYLRQCPGRADIRSAFSGLRPLAAAAGDATAELSREHAILCGTSGLVTVVGGKWTTFRRMAEAVVDTACAQCGLSAGRSRTASLGLPPATAPATGPPLVPGLPLSAAACRHAVRHTMARRTEDVLARRSRALLLDARAALAAAPAVVALVAEELGRDAAWAARDLADFQGLATRYIVDP
jgi:glycerol-3-phosphate dehydrogenase